MHHIRQLQWLNIFIILQTSIVMLSTLFFLQISPCNGCYQCITSKSLLELERAESLAKNQQIGKLQKRTTTIIVEMWLRKYLKLKIFHKHSHSCHNVEWQNHNSDSNFANAILNHVNWKQHTAWHLLNAQFNVLLDIIHWW